MDRSLPTPRNALRNELTTLRRRTHVTRLRQRWTGKVLTFPPSTLVTVTRTAFSLASFETIAILPIDPGAWAVTGRTILTIRNQPGVSLYTGREGAQARLAVVDPQLPDVILEEIDISYASPSATPEPAHAGGALDLQLNMFGLAVTEEPRAIIVMAQAYDTEEAAHECSWYTKIMAVPV
jgi:hypothetical protein